MSDATYSSTALPTIYDFPPEILRMVFEIFHAPDYENVDSTLFDVARVCKSWRNVVIRIMYQLDTSKLGVREIGSMSVWLTILERGCAKQRAESKRRIAEQIASRQMCAETIQRVFQPQQV